MARPRSHRPARHLALMALATVGAAQKYTLNSFDPLSSNTIPAACRAAYAAPLEGCRRSDFVEGRVCSAACVQSVDQMEVSIQAACGGVLLPIDTLLAQALLGNLRELLCPGARDPPVQQPTLQPTVQPTVIQPPPQSSPRPSQSTRRPSSVPPGNGNSPTPTPQLSTIIPNQPTTTRSSLTTVIVTEIVPPSSITAPVIFTPTPVPAPTVATPPNPPSNNPPPAGNNGGGGGGSGPGGNDILNPLPSVSWTLLPRLDLTVAAVVLSYLIL
ncbi:hypothetical protein F5X68DRAFT_230434 [Plectosphaerella plurivora]|uniref:Uncharacterized protein n=1 Tax=Plectosphaerella plurivora TaxID=936078 RepID=A0A9P8VDY3_9PEZI|nr:hypothetical protein F5X68DRAFT_230434 [Plectosphaerella plurivora]